MTDPSQGPWHHHLAAQQAREEEGFTLGQLLSQDKAPEPGSSGWTSIPELQHLNKGSVVTKTPAPRMGCSASSHTLSTKKETETRSRVEVIVTPPSSASSRDKQKLSVKIAEELLVASKGKRFHDHYVRPTLASYGASCKVLTAYSRSTQRKCAVKTIPKVS